MHQPDICKAHRHQIEEAVNVVLRLRVGVFMRCGAGSELSICDSLGVP